MPPSLPSRHSSFSGVQILERYEVGGRPSFHPRRDLRRGRARCLASLLPPAPDALLLPPPAPLASPARAAGVAPARLQLHLSWGEPFGGHAVDEFTLLSPDELVVRSRLFVHGGRSLSMRTVYVRRRK
mmetsp:Transcript_15230/g.44853  ORF Transcript_15230/g.44853 Transcript_15230/m.44853 type:complete len:128 (-) Transcript_15230:569-952(-)|eukprot:353618-Chlamydomonas_euryale.AAC.4